MKYTASEGFAAVLELYDFALQQMRANLRRRQPLASDAEIEVMLGEWAIERPGAEHGDGP